MAFFFFVCVCFSLVAVGQDGAVTEATVSIVQWRRAAAGLGRYHDSNCEHGGQK